MYSPDSRDVPFQCFREHYCAMRSVQATGVADFSNLCCNAVPQNIFAQTYSKQPRIVPRTVLE